MRHAFWLTLLASMAMGDTLLKNQGVNVGPVKSLNCAAGLTCTRSADTGTITGSTLATTADITYYVATTGNDAANDCLSAGAPCLTFQGAINKAPKNLKHRVTIIPAAGNYAGAIFSGFIADSSAQSTSAGVVIDAPLGNSTVATGLATGTATSATAGANEVFSTLIDSTATWTTNDLRGRFLKITSGTGSGQIKVIGANTATTITIVGTFTTTPVAGSTYAIMDPTVFVTTCKTRPPIAAFGAGGSTLAFYTSGNSNVLIGLRGLGITAACSFGVVQSDLTTLAVTQTQFSSTSGTASRVTLSANGGAGTIDTVSSTYSGTASGNHINGGNAGMTVVNSLFVNGFTAVNMNSIRGSGSVNFSQIINVGSIGVSSTAGVNNGANQIDCGSAANSIGWSATLETGQPPANVFIQHSNIQNCAYAVKAWGPGVWVNLFVDSFTTGLTTGVEADYGAMIFAYLAGGVTITASGSEVSLEQGSVTSTLSGIGSCLTSLSYGSRVCTYYPYP